MKQFNFYQLIEYLFIKKKSNSYFKSWDNTFSIIETIIYILYQSLNKFNQKKQKNFVKLIG